MLRPVLTIDGINGKTLVIYVKSYPEVRRDTIVLRVGDEDVEIRASDAIMLSKVIDVEVEKSHNALMDDIQQLMFASMFDFEDDRMFG